MQTVSDPISSFGMGDADAPVCADQALNEIVPDVLASGLDAAFAAPARRAGFSGVVLQ